MRKLNAKQKAYLKRVGSNWDMGELESMGDFETIYQEAERFIQDEGLVMERCSFCGKAKRIGKPCTCKYGGVFG